LISSNLFCNKNIFNRNKIETEDEILFLQLSTANSFIIEWFRIWKGSGFDSYNAITLDSSSSIYVAGHRRRHGIENFDICLLKYNSSGILQWDTTWSGSSDDYGSGVAIYSLDNIYIAGYTGSYGVGAYDLCLVKYDSSGAQQWNRTWGGSDYDAGRGVAVDSTDNIYVAGYTNSFGTEGEDMYFVKFGIDSDGDGLSDWQEVNIYPTNPNDPDTDGDGFSDGEDAFNGYDPNNKWSNPFMAMIIIIITVIIFLAILGIMVFISYQDLKRNREKEQLERELEEREEERERKRLEILENVKNIFRVVNLLLSSNRQTSMRLIN